MKHIPASRRQAPAEAASIPTLTPSSAKTSVAPEREDAALPPCLATGTPAAGGDNRRQCGNIIGVGAVAAGAHDVDGVLRRLDPDHGGAHRLRRADQFLGGFAALAQRHQKSAELRRRRRALQNQRKNLPRPLARQTFAFGQRGENGFERAHATLAREGCELFHSRARSRKLRRILWPCCEVMLSG